MLPSLGKEGVVEIESEWMGRGRERMGSGVASEGHGTTPPKQNPATRHQHLRDNGGPGGAPPGC